MCQRAHNHRQEYRAIRKERRLIRQALAALPKIAESMGEFAQVAMTSFVEAMTRAQQALREFFESVYPFGRVEFPNVGPHSSSLIITDDQ